MKLRWINERSKMLAKTQKSSQYSEKLDIPKYALKKVSEAYLPQTVIYRKKQGFPVPLARNIETLKARLPVLEDCGWIKNYSSLWDDLNTLLNPGQALWMLLNIERFRQLYFEHGTDTI
jgi:asparagine synthase (glutamine-hydrolysing)